VRGNVADSCNTTLHQLLFFLGQALSRQASAHLLSLAVEYSWPQYAQSIFFTCCFPLGVCGLVRLLRSRKPLAVLLASLRRWSARFVRGAYLRHSRLQSLATTLHVLRDGLRPSTPSPWHAPWPVSGDSRSSSNPAHQIEHCPRSTGFLPPLPLAGPRT